MEPQQQFQPVAPTATQTPTPTPTPMQGSNSDITSLIPYKNSSALISYYLGVFGLIPFIGIPMAITAIILGIFGLKHHKEHPESKGKGHAITGIVLGSISVTAMLLFVVLVAVSSAQ
jgi:Domain of unknown function (DUF4190)